jgi:hypothetical protein
VFREEGDMKRTVLLLAVALCVFGGLPRIVAARNSAIHGYAQKDVAKTYDAGPFQPRFGFNGGDLEDGGRSPFGQ